MSGDLGAITSGNAPFSGFTSEDFDAYQQKKWRSNAYTLARREAKDKLIALARSVQAELSDELFDLELGASSESPSVENNRQVKAQWAFFTRPAEDRASLKPLLTQTDLHSGAALFDIAVQHQHACLYLRLDEDGLGIGFEVADKASVDRDNIRTKLKESWVAETLLPMVHALSDDTRIGPADDLRTPSEVTAEALTAWSEALSATSASFHIETALPRTDETVRSDESIIFAVEALRPLEHLYRFLAWSRDNDYSGLKAAVQKEKEAQRDRVQSFQPGAQVAILSGLFAGRTGYFSELEGKGKAKVMVGPVSISVDLKDLREP